MSCSVTMRFRAASPIHARLMLLLRGAPGTGNTELWTRASLSIHWLWNVYLQVIRVVCFPVERSSS